MTTAHRESPARQRIVSLVPSLTADVAALGAGERIVGCTDYCERGAPASAARVGGTKNPDLPRVIGLAPDLVLVNLEENRPADIAALEDAGLAVHRTFPRSVEDVPDMLEALASALGVAPGHWPSEIRSAIADVGEALPRPLRTLTLIWRRPWMAAAADTYLADLLSRAGLTCALDGGGGDRWPKVSREGLGGLHLDVVVLPSEPYVFTDDDLPAVRELVGEGPCLLLADGAALTWHGALTLAGLRHAEELARQAQYRCSGAG